MKGVVPTTLRWVQDIRHHGSSFPCRLFFKKRVHSNLRRVAQQHLKASAFGQAFASAKGCFKAQPACMEPFFFRKETFTKEKGFSSAKASFFKKKGCLKAGPLTASVTQHRKENCLLLYKLFLSTPVP